ncbi:DUF3017 domain-containing protein [Nocardiopsis ansamitocini]|uniref:DUF3017 domain-containing protein n=1 Tax=Nocardiopsis ansamitocini TaxID=1670832 RepID=A0A9W6UI47_9ACTN|nr:DUF3017 domain-containing protein [Nocardiopsis ansamitocini]GLU49561.1 hypothetical protein Nans01_39120 [Nocardiopsis ansamitocini]
MSQKTVEAAVARQSDPPEEPGGDTVDSGSAPRAEVPGWLSQVPYFLVLSMMSSGIVVVAAAYFKRGPAIIAGALLLGAIFRLLLPPKRVGMLAVRRRWIDVTTLVTLAVLLIVLAWVAPQL